MEAITDHIQVYIYNLHLWVVLSVTGGPVPSVSAAEVTSKLGGLVENLGFVENLVLLQLPWNSKATPTPRLEEIKPASSRFVLARTPVSEGGFHVTMNRWGFLELGADFRNSRFLLASHCRGTGNDIIRGKPVPDFLNRQCTRLSESDTTGLCKRCAERARKTSPQATLIDGHPLPDRKRRNVDLACGIMIDECFDSMPIIDLAPQAPNGSVEPDDGLQRIKDDQAVGAVRGSPDLETANADEVPAVDDDAFWMELMSCDVSLQRIKDDLKETVDEPAMPRSKRTCFDDQAVGAVRGSPLPDLEKANAEEVPTDDDDEFLMRFFGLSDEM